MKKASGRLEGVYCIKGKHRVSLTVTGYDDTGKRGGIRVTGKCPAGHDVSTFAGKDAFAAAVASGKVIKGGAAGGKCPYSGSGAESDDFAGAAMFEGAAKRRSRGSRKGSRHSRKGSRKSHGSRKGSRKSRGSRKGSRKSRSHGHKK